MRKKFINIPYGYVESNGLVSKKTQVENLLESVKEGYSDNAELDEAQELRISSNTEMIQNEVERSTVQDTSLQDALSVEISDRKRMGTILNNKISDLESKVNGLPSGDASAVEVKLNDEISRATAAENNLKEMILSNSTATEAIESRVTTVENNFIDFKTSGISLSKNGDLEYNLMVDGTSVGTINIPQDNFLKDVKLENGKYLVFTFITGDENTKIKVDVSKLIDIYTAGDGLSVASNKFSIKIDRTSESFISISTNGVKLSGINDAIKDAVNVEASAREKSVEDLTVIVNENKANIAKEISDRTSAVDAEKNRAVGIEQALDNRLVKVEESANMITSLSNTLSNVQTQLFNETSRAKGAEEKLQGDLDALSSSMTNNDDEIKSMISAEEKRALGAEDELSSKITNEVDNVQEALTNVINEEVSRAKDAEAKIEDMVNEEISKLTMVDDNLTGRIDKVEANKVDWTDLGSGRKSITLANNDMILGTDLNGATYNIAMLSKWDVIDFGSSSKKPNINTPKGVKPTIQEAGQSGEEANEMAYMSDVESVKAMIPSLDGYATIDEVENVKTLIPSLDGYAKEEWVEDKGYLTEHQDLSNYVQRDEMMATIDELKTLIDKLENRVVELESMVYTPNQFMDMISSIKEGESADLKLYSNITISADDKMVVPKNSTLNLDLNGQTLVFKEGDILFRVSEGATLNISGGTFIGEGYAASVNEGGTINVVNGDYTSEVTTFQANGGVVNIYDGYYHVTSETYGTKYTLNHIDKNKFVGKINVYGGTFVNYDPSNSYSENPPMNFVAEGYGVVEMVEGENTLYKVVKSTQVSNNAEFESMLNNMTSSENAYIELSEDLTINSEEKIRVNGDVTINLNGKTLTHEKEDILFRVEEGGTLTIVGGNVVTKGYVASANKGSVINVENGIFESDTTCIQSNGGVVNISGGYYSACNDTYGCRYTLNMIDSMKEVGKINVTGGKFVGFDPSHSDSENPQFNFVPEGYKVIESVEDGLTIYEVVKA